MFIVSVSRGGKMDELRRRVNKGRWRLSRGEFGGRGGKVKACEVEGVG